MLVGSFYSGLAGLNANAQALNVIGNNLANVNTVAFKQSQTQFAQTIANTVQGVSGAGNPKQQGLGVSNSQTIQKFEQGSIQNTGIKTNLAIQGNGFFTVEKNGTKQYTRAGNFSLDDSGTLVSHDGAVVQGYLDLDEQGNLQEGSQIGPIQVDLGKRNVPKATTTFRMLTNLSAEAEEGDTYNSSIEVFDGKGVAHSLGLTYTKASDPSTWDYQFHFEDGQFNPAPATAGDPPPFPASGQLIFDTQGKLAAIGPSGGPFSVLTDTGSQDIRINIDQISNGGGSLALDWDIENDVSQVEGTPYITEHSSRNSTGSLYQDGYGAGVLADIDFQQDGTIVGFYDNGLSLPLGKIALASFRNNHGLRQLDGGFYVSTQASGSPKYNGEDTSTEYSVISGSLESSNIDVAEEFTNMIVNQRGYQSNSKTISTADQLLQEAINLKR